MSVREGQPPRTLSADAGGTDSVPEPEAMPGITRVGQRGAPPAPAGHPNNARQEPAGRLKEAPSRGEDSAELEPATAMSGNLIPTGISGLDAQFGGGLPAGNMILVTSAPTTATSIFAAQYGASGLDAGETVVYVSLERPADEVEAQVRSFVENPAAMGRLHIIDGYPMQFRDMPVAARKRLGVGVGEDPLETLEELLEDEGLTGPVRFVVESYTELSWIYGADRIMRDLRLLRATLRARQATALVMIVTPLHEPPVVAGLKHMCDGVIEFDLERKGFGLYPYISVTKMRGVAGSTRLLVYKETPTGLWIESTKRVF